MFCHNCGYDLSKSKINNTKNKYLKENNLPEENLDAYVCPRCGELIHSNLTEEETKHLSQAAHSEMHRAHNLKNKGLCALVISLILIAIGMLFFILSFKVSNAKQLDVNCIEFYVFCALAGLGAIIFIYGAINLSLGIAKNFKYKEVVKAIQNSVFVQ